MKAADFLAGIKVAGYPERVHGETKQIQVNDHKVTIPAQFAWFLNTIKTVKKYDFSMNGNKFYNLLPAIMFIIDDPVFNNETSGAFLNWLAVYKFLRTYSLSKHFYVRRIKIRLRDYIMGLSTFMLFNHLPKIDIRPIDPESEAAFYTKKLIGRECPLYLPKCMSDVPCGNALSNWLILDVEFTEGLVNNQDKIHTFVNDVNKMVRLFRASDTSMWNRLFSIHFKKLMGLK